MELEPHLPKTSCRSHVLEGDKCPHLGNMGCFLGHGDREGGNTTLEALGSARFSRGRVFVVIASTGFALQNLQEVLASDLDLATTRTFSIAQAISFEKLSFISAEL